MAALAPSTVRKVFSSALGEVFWQRRAAEAAAKRSPEQQLRVRHLTDAVDSRLAVVDSLAGAREVAAALSILARAAVLAIRAVLEERGIRTSLETATSALQKIDPLIESGELPAPPEEWPRVRELLLASRHLAFDELPAAEALRRRSETEVVVTWLRNLVESRSLPEIHRSRFLRMGAGAAVVAAILAWLVVRGLTPENIALGKPVQISSRRPDCPPGTGEAGLPPSGAVDGAHGGGYDVCTKYEVRPWLTIDLGSMHRLTKAIVYYRGDCCFGLFDLPAVFELSEDGNTFVEVGRRTTAYSSQDPWTIPLGGKRAKIVRLRVDSNEPKELVLTEVEVFGSRW